MKTVHEVSQISGVSVRALHHYDAIGLLKPTKVTEAGYRLYDESAMKRLQTILMFRELHFSLGSIKEILDTPAFDLQTALGEHIEMLKMQRAHIDRLIAEAQRMMKGENADFTAFDKREMEQYAEEVKARWGKTDAYRESEETLSKKTDEERKDMAEGMMKLFATFGNLKTLAPDSPEVQAAVKALQDYISVNAYTCTKEILSGLGEMYTADDRFRENIDGAGGEGTAEFVGRAIKVYCQAK